MKKKIIFLVIMLGFNHAFAVPQGLKSGDSYTCEDYKQRAQALVDELRLIAEKSAAMSIALGPVYNDSSANDQKIVQSAQTMLYDFAVESGALINKEPLVSSWCN